MFLQNKNGVHNLSSKLAGCSMKILPCHLAGEYLHNGIGIRTGAVVNDVPGARQSRDPACAAAQVESLRQNERTPFRFRLAAKTALR